MRPLEILKRIVFEIESEAFSYLLNKAPTEEVVSTLDLRSSAQLHRESLDPMQSNKKKKGKGKAKARRKKTNSAATSSNEDTLAVAAPITETPAQTAHQILVHLGRSLMSGAGDQDNYPCLHGLPSLELSDQIECQTFLTTFFDEIEKHDNGGHVVNAAALAMQETLPNTPVASLTESTQKLINAWFVCIGVRCLLEVTTIADGYDKTLLLQWHLRHLSWKTFARHSFPKHERGMMIP